MGKEGGKDVKKETKKENTGKVQIGCTIDKKLKKSLNERVENSGKNQSAIIRSALKKYIDEGVDDCEITLNLVEMMYALNELEGTITEEQKQNFNVIKNSLNHITSIKGGR